MAEHLASIFGTEKDKVNCSFYFKIGACRHGDRCSRIHNKPTFSQTVVLQVRISFFLENRRLRYPQMFFLKYISRRNRLILPFETKTKSGGFIDLLYR